MELFTGLHRANRRLLVPGTVAAEVGYLLNREAGARIEALFLTALADGDFTPVDLTGEDHRRAAELRTPRRAAGGGPISLIGAHPDQ